MNHIREIKRSDIDGFQIGNAEIPEAGTGCTLILAEKALSINPQFAAAYNNLGLAYNDMHDYTKAIDCYKKALSINPQHAYAYNNLGNAYYHLHDYTKAIDFYKKALSINPQFADAYNNLGITYKKLKRYHEAKYNFAKAYELNPSDTSIAYQKKISENW